MERLRQAARVAPLDDRQTAKNPDPSSLVSTRDVVEALGWPPASKGRVYNMLGRSGIEPVKVPSRAGLVNFWPVADIEKACQDGRLKRCRMQFYTPPGRKPQKGRR